MRVPPMKRSPRPIMAVNTPTLHNTKISPMILPSFVTGVMSPYPTVLMVTTEYQSASR